MPTRSGRRLAAALVALGLVADLAAASLVASVQPRILHGAPTTAFPEVCVLEFRRAGGTRGLCSGTVVAPAVVLTAAHCLIDVTEVEVVCEPAGARIAVGAAEWAMHPEYGRRPHADIGLVFLRSALGGILPATLPNARPTRRRGELVGYGVDGADPANRKRAGRIKLLKRCPRKARRRVGLERGALVNSLCWKPRRGGVDACIGDSGGPLFVDGELVGVTAAAITASPVGCPGTLSWSTNVSSFRRWIDDEMAARGAQPASASR